MKFKINLIGLVHKKPFVKCIDVSDDTRILLYDVRLNRPSSRDQIILMLDFICRASLIGRITVLVILVELNVINLHTFKMVTKIQQFCMHCNGFFSTGLLCAAAKDEKSPGQDSVVSLMLNLRSYF